MEGRFAIGGSDECGPNDCANPSALPAKGLRMIPRVHGITRFARVPVPHTNDATYTLDTQGNEWIAKREADMGCEALLAEAVTWLLARQLGVRVPDAAFCDAPTERAWLSRRIPDAVHWSALRSNAIANPRETAAIIVLDADGHDHLGD